MGGSRRHLKRNKPKVRVRLPKKTNPAPPDVKLPDSEETLQWDRKLSLPANYAALGLVSKPSAFKVAARTLPAANGASASASSHTEATLPEESMRPGGQQQQQQQERASAPHVKIELVRIVNGRVVSSREAVEDDGCEAGTPARTGEVRVIDCARVGEEGREEAKALTGGGGTDADYFGPTADGGARMEGEEGSHELRATLGETKRDASAPPPRLTKMQRTYVGRLISAHGIDYQAMARDLKLNRMQHTAATLRCLSERYIAHELKAQR